MSYQRSAYESRINIHLSELLSQHNVISRAEIINSGRRDIVVYHQGLVCVIEGSYSKRDAEKDAKKRIEQLNADIALAVHYKPSDFPQSLSEIDIKRKLLTTKLSIRVIVPEDISGTLFEILHQKRIIAKPLAEWYDFSFNSLITLIQEVGQFILSEEVINRTEGEVSSFIERFVEFLSNHRENIKIARNLYDILYKLYGFSIGNPDLIKEAIFAQSTLALLLSAIYYETVKYAHNLRSIRQQDLDPQIALKKAFHDILEIDYREIFITSKAILDLLPSSQRLFNQMIDLATKIASQRTLLKRDLAGKIYHKVVGEWSLRKGLATYYTEIPSAYLLAYLGKPSLSRICDFACGSGTLLVATYSAANFEYRFNLFRNNIEREPQVIEKEFHEVFLKNCYAFDVLSYATQVTAVNLAFHSPETPLEGFNTFTVPLGAKNGEISLGSLEFVRRHGSIFDSLTVVEKTNLNYREERFLQEFRNLEPFDFIIMNPPFTRATGRGGREGGGLFGFIAELNNRNMIVNKYESLRKEVRNRLLENARLFLRDKDLFFLLNRRDFMSYSNIGQAGEGLLFIYLADAMIKEEGKICFVLPKNFLSASTWFLARVLILSRYHLETVVVSYDSENGYNFSESTSLSECLFVARKTQTNSDLDETRFLILLRKPKTSIEAISLVNELEEDKDYVEVGRASALVLKVNRQKLIENLDNWGKFVFLPSIKIIDQTSHLLDGYIEVSNTYHKVPLTKLENLIESIGIDAHHFYDNFEVISHNIPEAKKIIYGGEENRRLYMETTPNAYAKTINAGDRLFIEKAGKLIVPDRIRIDTAHVITMLSTEKILSNIFYTIKLRDEDESKLKALCLWFNTTWGMLTILANKQETEGGWIRLKMSQWRILPVLDINKIPVNVLSNLSQVYDNFKQIDLGRIPRQYEITPCQNRKNLDSAFLHALGISVYDDYLMTLYENIFRALRQWLG